MTAKVITFGPLRRSASGIPQHHLDNAAAITRKLIGNSIEFGPDGATTINGGVREYRPYEAAEHDLERHFGLPNGAAQLGAYGDLIEFAKTGAPPEI